MKFIAIIALLFCSTLGYSQDTLNDVPYNSYRNKIVLYSDLGFSSAPFTLSGDFSNNISKLKYRHNQQLIMGLGFAYKWMALRIGFGLPIQMRPVSKFGPSRYFDLGFKFNLKQTFWDVDVRNYAGYVLKDANQWNDTLSASEPHLKIPNTNSINFSINCWYFRSKNFKMNSVLGKKGDYNQSHGTWYFKSSLNIFGSGNGLDPMMPAALVDTTLTIYRAEAISALDIGLIPGYAYVYRWNNWQITGFGGFGGVIQSKFYAFDGNDRRGFLGLAPRLDLRFIAGYSKKNYFFWLHTNFDVKSIRFREVAYRQTYNTIRVVAGVRLDKKEKKNKE